MAAELAEKLPKFIDEADLSEEELVVLNRTESAQGWVDQAEQAPRKCQE